MFKRLMSLIRKEKTFEECKENFKKAIEKNNDKNNIWQLKSCMRTIENTTTSHEGVTIRVEHYIFTNKESIIKSMNRKVLS